MSQDLRSLIADTLYEVKAYSLFGVRARGAVEAAISPGWDRYIGENGVFVGLKGFGLSAPADVLFRHFGITPENVVTQIKAALARRADIFRRRGRRFGMDVVG